MITMPNLTLFFLLSTLKIYGAEVPDEVDPRVSLEVRLIILESALAKSEGEREKLQRALKFERAMQEALQEANLESGITAFGLKQEISDLGEDVAELQKQLQAALSHTQQQDDRVDAQEAEIRDLQGQLNEASQDVYRLLEIKSKYSAHQKKLEAAINKLREENARLRKLLNKKPR